ncbi:MFS transporter [Spirulina sp. CS-785/01]|uniref:MFS transporter n=1 Tax=Spirulina sp. CS-785/01 TaxID=3021716 RepID=UPI00232D1E66|nr:MFS transporter [Spirulina sp. CS-785/01]MDB9311560.1 MFS transporter [Spirulina sp. CS-785/01]
MQEQYLAPNSQPSQPEPLKFSTKLAYGAGDLGAAMTANVLIFFLLYFFTNVAGLPAGLASAVLAIGKVSDAINDPLTGILSDRTRTRWGRRIPWMLGGIIPFGILFILHWLVPAFSQNTTWNQWLLFIYYVLIAVLFNLAFTAVNLPYTALTPELTQDYNERTRLNSFRMAFSIGGSILSLVLAQIIFQVYDQDIVRYPILGGVCAFLGTVATLWCVFRIQERGAEPVLSFPQRRGLGIVLLGVAGLAIVWGIGGLLLQQTNLFWAVMGLLFGVIFAAAGMTLRRSSPESHLVNELATQTRLQSHSVPTLSFVEQLKIVFKTKPFLYVIGIYLCAWLGVQLIASILIYYVVSWMGLPESQFPSVAIAVQGTALVMLFIWQKISNQIGKKKVFFAGTLIWILAEGGLFFLEPGQTNLMYGLAILAGCGVSVAYLIPWSMVPDIIELDELETGYRREGIFYGFMILLQKIGLALALFLVGVVLELNGFQERPPGGDIPIQPDSALLAIRVAISLLPTLFLIGGLVLAYFYPITQEVHQDIRAKIEAKKRQNQSINQ